MKGIQIQLLKTNNENKANEKKNLDNLISNNEDIIKEKAKHNNNKDDIIKDKNMENDFKDYKIYEVNTFRMIQKEENNNNNKDESNKIEIKNEKKEINKNGKNKNSFINSNIPIEKEKTQKINVDEYMNKVKEKLNQIRNKSNVNKNINTKRKIKTTLNYILHKDNDIINNNSYKINDNEQIENDNNMLTNIKGNSQNKYIIKTSNRMKSFLSNIKEIQNRKNNFQENEIKKDKSFNINNIPNIKSIVDKKQIEVFDEDEFIQIKKRNLSSTKVNINLNKDLKFLDKTLKLQNINCNYNVGKKVLFDENILPPNKFDFKDIFSKTLFNNISKK